MRKETMMDRLNAIQSIIYLRCKSRLGEPGGEGQTNYLPLTTRPDLIQLVHTTIF